jgi:cell division protease FtsH
MVARWGMSDVVGPVSMLPRDGQTSVLDPSAPSDETRKLVDDEVRRIVEECYGEALEVLRANRDKLDKLAVALLERENLDEKEAYAVAGVTRSAPDQEVPLRLAVAHRSAEQPAADVA